MQWVAAVEDCEYKPPVWEKRWPRIQNIVQMHFTCWLTAKTRTRAAPRKSDYFTTHDRLRIYRVQLKKGPYIQPAYFKRSTEH